MPMTIAFDNGLLDLLRSFDKATSVEEGWTTALEFLNGTGFDRIAYAFAHHSTGDGEVPAAQFLDNYPDWFNERYHSRGYMACDPWVRLGTTGLTPKRMRRYHLPDADEALQRDFYGDMTDTGWRDGVLFPLGCSGRIRIAGLSVANAMGEEEFSRLMRDRGPLVQAAVYAAHAKLELLIVREERNARPLTPRERECLLWTASGLTSKGVARKLGVTDKAVDFHLRNAMTKLQVATRTQAVAKAILLGAIEP